jgi:hypothetical protein
MTKKKDPKVWTTDTGAVFMRISGRTIEMLSPSTRAIPPRKAPAVTEEEMERRLSQLKQTVDHGMRRREGTSITVIGERQAKTNESVARNKLVAVVRALAAEKRKELEEHKAGSRELARPDFLWHVLLQSFATMGRKSGWDGLIGNQQNYKRVTYGALAGLPPKIRQDQVRRVCRAAAVRMPEKKAGYILGCFEAVKHLGGPKAATTQLLKQPGRTGKIDFLKRFPGIGDKYARNIMMDVYHEDFRDSIALDVRIKAISDALGLSFPSYDEHEAFYLRVAKEARLNGWELDRLLFNFRPEVEARLGIQTVPRGRSDRYI